MLISSPLACVASKDHVLLGLWLRRYWGTRTLRSIESSKEATIDLQKIHKIL